MTAKRWIVRRQKPEHAASIFRVLGTFPTAATLLLPRVCRDDCGVAFLEPTYDQLPDPYLMLGMRRAVSRLLQRELQLSRIALRSFRLG